MSPRYRGLAGIAVDEHTSTAARIEYSTPEWEAILEWLEFHGIDPKRIPAGTEVIRDAAACQIRYVACVLDDQGRVTFHPPDHPEFASLVTVPAVEQGEAPPLPYPDVIARLLQPIGRPA